MYMLRSDGTFGMICADRIANRTPRAAPACIKLMRDWTTANNNDLMPGGWRAEHFGHPKLPLPAWAAYPVAPT